MAAAQHLSRLFGQVSLGLKTCISGTNGPCGPGGETVSSTHGIPSEASLEVSVVAGIHGDVEEGRGSTYRRDEERGLDGSSQKEPVRRHLPIRLPAALLANLS